MHSKVMRGQGGRANQDSYRHGAVWGFPASASSLPAPKGKFGRKMSGSLNLRCHIVRYLD